MSLERETLVTGRRVVHRKQTWYAKKESKYSTFTSRSRFELEKTKLALNRTEQLTVLYLRPAKQQQQLLVPTALEQLAKWQW